jgi:hypothetical protein
MIGPWHRWRATRLREQVILLQRDVARLKSPDFNRTRALLYQLRTELERMM